MNEVLFETENYKITVGKSQFVFTAPEVSPDLYIVTNKRTGIVEAENRVLGTAIGWCKHIDGLLVEAEKSAAKPDALDEIPDAGPATIPV